MARLTLRKLIPGKVEYEKKIRVREITFLLLKEETTVKHKQKQTPLIKMMDVLV